MSARDSSLTWSTKHDYGPNSLAHQFPSFQISARDAASGGVRVEARSPSGRVMDMGVGEQNGIYTANFTPTEVGDWIISILFEGQHIQGSPFNVRVYDAAQVKVFGLEGGSVGKTFAFSIDCSQAGDGEPHVDIMRNGRAVHCTTTPEGSTGTYRSTFLPDGPGVYTIRVYFAGMEVSGSPYTLEIVDSSTITASGEGLSAVEVNQKAVFFVNAGANEVRATVLDPRGHQIPCQVTPHSDGTTRVEYSALEVGEYCIDVYYYGKPIQGSPFRVNAFDWNRITVQNLKGSGIVGKLVEFDIDAAYAGSGNLEIMVNDGTIPCSVQNRGNRQFHASFVPKDAMIHLVQMKFNGREVPGSPWRVDIRSALHVTASGQGLQTACVQHPAVFEVRAGAGSPSDAVVQVHITSPLKRIVPCQVVNQYNGVYRVEYVPQEVGNHQIEVQYEGLAIASSPFTSKVYDPSAILVSNVGSGMVGKPVEFEIDVTSAGEGQLEIMVNRGSVPNTVKMVRKGVFLVSFVPRDARNHIIDIKFNGELLRHCPIQVPILDTSRVTVQGDGIRQVAVNRSSYFRVNTTSAGEADLQVRVTSPNGDLVPAKIVQQPDGDYKVEYSSKWTGRHTVEILYAGAAIMGSPFFVEIYDPNKLRVEGVRGGIIGEVMAFDIVRHEAGKAELGLTITSPSGRNVPYEITPTPKGEHVTYVPQEVGPHHIYITYGGLEVPGCPLTQTIQDNSTAQAFGDGLLKGEEDKTSTFFVDTQGKTGDLKVTVDGPNSVAKVVTEFDRSGKYVVSYVPVEVGIYKIYITWNGREVQGCPFQPKVVHAGKVRPVHGWQTILDENNQMKLEVNRIKRIELDCLDAGPGQLTAEVKDPSNRVVPCEIDQRGGGIHVISFMPREPGNHYLRVWWADVPLPKTPLEGVAVGETVVQPPPPIEIPVNHEKVILTGKGLKEARVNEEAEFVIDGTEAGPGDPAVTLVGVKENIKTHCYHLGGNKYRYTYVPQVPGAYLLNISWSDRQVRGSPFKVNVVASCDASRVVCTGEGLKMGIMGKEIKSVIDTRRAGPGELTAHCRGPSKTAYCELYDNRDGTFTLNFKPQECGRHILDIKYGGVHVPGSPYTVKVSAPPDASKVRVSGPGIEHGILPTFRSSFVVETRGAGAGQLTVRIRGPKGAFRVEMQRESQKDRSILCRYDPTEVGDYILHVKWSGEHVPGSPFRVQICDTTDELERAMAEQSGNRMLTNKSWNADI